MLPRSTVESIDRPAIADFNRFGPKDARNNPTDAAARPSNPLAARNPRKARATREMFRPLALKRQNSEASRINGPAIRA